MVLVRFARNPCTGSPAVVIRDGTVGSGHSRRSTAVATMFGARQLQVLRVRRTVGQKASDDCKDERNSGPRRDGQPLADQRGDFEGPTDS